MGWLPIRLAPFLSSVTAQKRTAYPEAHACIPAAVLRELPERIAWRGFVCSIHDFLPLFSLTLSRQEMCSPLTHILRNLGWFVAAVGEKNDFLSPL